MAARHLYLDQIVKTCIFKTMRLLGFERGLAEVKFISRGSDVHISNKYLKLIKLATGVLGFWGFGV